MGLRRFERRIEHLVEGTMARVFKSGLSPVEIGRRIIREIDANKSVTVDGSLAVPNHYWIFLSTPDHRRIFDDETTITNGLIDIARNHITAEQYRLLGPVSVAFVEAPGYPEGTLQVQAEWREGPSVHGHTTLVFASGERIAIGLQPSTVGRAYGNTIVLDDESVSRNHAVIRPALGGWLITDLNSTNGTIVNGARISETQLAAGDAIVFGRIEAIFETG